MLQPMMLHSKRLLPAGFTALHSRLPAAAAARGARSCRRHGTEASRQADDFPALHSLAGQAPVSDQHVTALLRELGVDSAAQHTLGRLRALERLLPAAEEAGEDSVLVCNADDIVAAMRRWQALLPEVTPFYAVKCNPHESLLQLLGGMGCGFDVASRTEAEAVLALPGMTAQRLLYANPCKPRAHLRAAAAAGVQWCTFDNEAELVKLAAEMPDAVAVLRLSTDDASAVVPLSSKFGAPLDAVPELLRRAQALGVTVGGVSFHVGSNSRDPTAFPAALQRARVAFDFAAAAGLHMRLLDIGGGFPGSDDEAAKYGAPTFAQLAESIRDSIHSLFPTAADDGLQLIAEPGRYFVAASHALATRIVAERQVPLPDGRQQAQYYVADGLYGSFNCVLYDHAIVEPRLTTARAAQLSAQAGKLLDSCVFGPSCDAFDVIVKQVQLPQVTEGDWLLWDAMGAYTVAAGSSFNGFSSPSMQLVRAG